MNFSEFIKQTFLILQLCILVGVHQSWFPNNAWYFLRQNSAILTNLVADLDKTSFFGWSSSKIQNGRQNGRKFLLKVTKLFKFNLESHAVALDMGFWGLRCKI